MLRSLAAASSGAAGALRRLLHGACGEAESVAYRMSMLRAPPAVARWRVPENSCSFTGRLAAPVRLPFGSSDECPMAYTFLSVSSSSSSSSWSRSSAFQITLNLIGELAKVSLMYLKPKDFVYVSGFLSSYRKVDHSGKRQIFYKIYVTELNYVRDQNEKHWNYEESADTIPTLPATTQTLQENKYIDRLRLWQVFFASPYEWWDNRQSKPYNSYPDFKHKDTREKLWLHPDDPPWLRKQLELLDLKTAGNGHNYGGQLSQKHRWKDQDFE